MNRKRVIALAVLSALFYALISVCVKWIGGTLPSMEIAFFRAFVMLVLFAGPRMLKRQRDCNKHKALLILRGVSGALRASTQYAAIAQVPLAETMARVNLSPFVVTILASIFLKEKCGKRHIAALLIRFWEHSASSVPAFTLLIQAT